MKIAEALLLRADMKKKLASLRERIAANAVVQEKEKPHEDPAKLIKEAVGVLAELEEIALRIDRANQATKLADGRALAVAVAHRDTLAQHHSLLQAAIVASRKEPDRYSMKEIKWVATLEVAKLQKQCDDLAKQLRETNAAIQATNWQADID
ncbi:MAG: septicolysin [Planctomycetes bacterium]|nr:septicolysin [Planctomycetota bacterium]